MKKIFLIIQREFLSRVQKKSFLVATILVPLIFPAIIGVMIYLAIQEDKATSAKTVWVIDESKLFDFSDTTNAGKYAFVLKDMPLTEAKTAFNETEDYALLYIPTMSLDTPQSISFYSKNTPGISVIGEFERRFEGQIREAKLLKSGISQDMLDKLKADVSIETYMIEGENEKQSSADATFWISYATGFLIYIFLFAYGAQVMQGVIEEKNSKIVEIMISAVRPFQLMLGKIIGVASVGLFQVLIWVVLMTGIYTVGLGALGLKMPQQQMMEEVQNNMPEEAKQEADLSKYQDNAKVQKLISAIDSIPVAKITLLFLFYFIGGYLMYASLFAAVGSAVDTPSDAQQFMMPIMLPIIVSLMGLFMFVFKDPNGSISFWLSIIPFTSPITMMGRVAFGVPTWELILSMVLLIGGFMFTTWLAARIYRVGILMHGTKVNYKTLAKWFLQKN